ncbi:hypothetical protein [Paraburkholderia youngii]|uniref:hypothetical protein n=1 Tax=Paraburkholderia youngii TaxID=2782701 RepID=UPI003D19BBDD
MYQYDDPTVVSTLPTPAAAGTAGYFTDGNPASGAPATIMRSDFMNMIMMELLNVVQAGGLTPSKTTYNQLLAAIRALNAAFPVPINNTGASSDVALSIGQAAYIDISAATTAPLHIACGDNQSYEMELRLAGNTGINAGVLLLPNNVSYTNFFAWEQVYNNSTTPLANSGYSSGFYVSGADVRYRKASISTKTISKTVSSYGAAYVSGALGVSTDIMASFWQASASSNTVGDTTTAWTSLGTLTFPAAATGRILIKRVS